MKKYQTSISQSEIEPILEKLNKWCNRIHKTKYKVGYYTRTSTKNITFFTETHYPERLDGYFLTGLISRMSELNLHLEFIEHTEVADDKENKIVNCYVLKFEGSSLGKYYNPLYTISNNLKGHRLFPPHITKEES